MIKLLKYYYRRKRLSEFYSIEPVPIFFPEKRLVLLWNAKAGCTFAIKWMFSHMGLLKEAEEYHNWIHNYRIRVYNTSRQQLAGIKLFLHNPDSFNAIKVVSNPFKRVVRSYIQACIHEYEDKKLSSFLQREINPSNRFSFREFAHYLVRINVKQCDIHHKIQTSIAERLGSTKSINIVHLEESMNEIPKLENKFNLANIDIHGLRDSPHHRPKYQSSDFVGDKVMNEIYKVRRPTLPEHNQFYDQEIKSLIANVYEEDFERYNYNNDSIL